MIMSKISKLVTHPNLFFRDYFLKKAPLNYGENIKPLPIETSSHSKKNTAHKTPVSSDQPIEDPYPVTFPIDVVYTWVDSDDEKFNEERLKFQNSSTSETLQGKAESTDIARFQSHDELKYSIRSLMKYAPWVNHIYIVTNGQIPKWLDTNNTKVTIIPHSTIIDSQFLPTFNSHVIESSLYKIPGLSEHYIYFNDDVILTRDLSPSYFFTSSGLAKLFITNSRLPNSYKNVKDTPTQWASKNSRELLHAETGFWAEAMFAHTFHPQRKSVHESIEHLWHEQLNVCRQNRFRDISDINMATFLHHHFAILTGQALATRTKCIYFNIRSPQAAQHYKTLLARKGSEYSPHSICLNDHTSSNKNILSNYEAKLQSFLETYYPDVSEVEILLPTKSEVAELVKHKDYLTVYTKLLPIINKQLVNKYNKPYSYLFYYLGLSAQFLFKETQQEHYRETAEENLQIFCGLNPKHTLALKYLADVTLTSQPSGQ